MNISPSWLYTIPPPPSSAKVVPQPIAHTSPRIQPEYPGERGNLIPISGHRSSPNPITMEPRNDNRLETRADLIHFYFGLTTIHSSTRWLFDPEDRALKHLFPMWSSLFLGYSSVKWQHLLISVVLGVNSWLLVERFRYGCFISFIWYACSPTGNRCQCSSSTSCLPTLPHRSPWHTPTPQSPALCPPSDSTQVQFTSP